MLLVADILPVVKVLVGSDNSGAAQRAQPGHVNVHIRRSFAECPPSLTAFISALFVLWNPLTLNHNPYASRGSNHRIVEWDVIPEDIQSSHLAVEDVFCSFFFFKPSGSLGLVRFWSAAIRSESAWSWAGPLSIALTHISVMRCASDRPPTNPHQIARPGAASVPQTEMDAVTQTYGEITLGANVILPVVSNHALCFQSTLCWCWDRNKVKSWLKQSAVAKWNRAPVWLLISFVFKSLLSFSVLSASPASSMQVEREINGKLSFFFNLCNWNNHLLEPSTVLCMCSERSSPLMAFHKNI